MIMAANQAASASSTSGDQCKQVLFATWLGMFFDGMDASIFVLALFPTMSALLHTQDHAQVGLVGSYVLATFMIGWTVGSFLFGLVADRIGRVSTLIMTILLYAICTGLCATANSVAELAFYRFLVGCGIGGEISVGCVLLAETWRGRSRFWATGVMCTAFGFGYLATAAMNYGLGHLGWRWLYVAGTIPAILTLYIRLKLKNTLEHAGANTTGRQDRKGVFAQLFQRENQFKTICICVLASTCIVGYWAVLSWIPAWINQLMGGNAVSERSTAACVLNIGSILGALSLGWLHDKVGHRKAFFLSFLGAITSCITMFMTIKSFGLPLLALVFVVGFFVEAPFVPLMIYAPELFSSRIRATAFGASVQSGRLLAAFAAVTAGQIIAAFGGSYAIAGSIISLVYIVGMGAALVAPHTSGEVLPDSEPETKPARKKSLAELAESLT